MSKTIEQKSTLVNGFVIRKVEKRKSKLRIGVFGTSGSGKTYSSILLASGFCPLSKVCIIDTENGSADLYEGLGNYNVITLTPPFSPERYIQAIKAAESSGMEVVIVDSISHEWEGEGGCLEIVEQLTRASSSGNSYTVWGKVTPRHNAFIQAILQSHCHIIATARKKQDYILVEKNGKKVPEKAGLKEITREGFDYEMTIAFDLNQGHLATTSKDRTGLFMDKPEFTITKETGEILKQWSEEGVDMSKYAKKIVDLLKKKGQLLQHLYTKYKVTDLEQLNPSTAILIIENLKKLEDAPDVDKVAKDMEKKSGLESADAAKIGKDVEQIKEGGSKA